MLLVLSQDILETIPGSDDKTSRYPSCSFSSYFEDNSGGVMTKHRDILVLSRVILETIPGNDDKTSRYPCCSFSSYFGDNSRV